MMINEVNFSSCSDEDLKNMLAEVDSQLKLYSWEKFTRYNIVDTVLVKQLNDKLGLLETVFAVAYEAKVNFDEVSSPVKCWDALIANYCLDLDIVMPQQQYSATESLDGAYVKEPTPGWKRCVASIDATSLYPSNVITNNISPETYVGNCGATIEDFLAGRIPKQEGLIVTPAGAMYRKDKQGILPTIMAGLMATRKSVKKEMLRLEQVYEDTKDESINSKVSALDKRQNAIKTLLNSGYGATANKHFRFYKHDHAASITLTGQYALRTIENEIDVRLNELFGTKNHNYLIYIDTDSCYFDLSVVMDKIKIPADKLIRAIERVTAEKITPIVNEMCKKCCDNMNSFQNNFNFKLEVAADKAFWVAKKRYVVRVHSSEGVTYKAPKFKVKGLELVRSSTPAFVRDKLKNALSVMFDGDEQHVQQYISGIRNEFMQLPYNQIAMPRGVNNLEKYGSSSQIYSKGTGEATTPIHVRASLLYNHYLKEYGLTGKYPLIGEGSKIKFMYLTVPNMIRENVIAFPSDGEVPLEFKIHDKIDYNMQFDKTFLSSMQTMLSAVSWNAEEVSSLEEFFA